MNDKKTKCLPYHFSAAITTTRHRYYTKANKCMLMADFEYDNVVVKETVA